MKTKLQRCLHALEELNEASKGMNAICLPGEIDEAMEALKELIDKRPTCYVSAIGLEEMKKPGVRLAEVSNVEFDAWTVPLYRWGVYAKREHITDGTPCWCNPETKYISPETGVSVIVHKEPQ